MWIFTPSCLLPSSEMRFWFCASEMWPGACNHSQHTFDQVLSPCCTQEIACFSLVKNPGCWFLNRGVFVEGAVEMQRRDVKLMRATRALMRSQCKVTGSAAVTGTYKHRTLVGWKAWWERTPSRLQLISSRMPRLSDHAELSPDCINTVESSRF